jgi:choline dehydrogenase-like flavoprotein
MASERYDVIIIGTGAGGGTLAYRLAPSGKRILLLERGDFLPRERDNWDPTAVFVQSKYKARETWYGKDGRAFHPGIHYYVGGNTARCELQGARSRQSLCRRRQLLPVERRGESGADHHGERPACR